MNENEVNDRELLYFAATAARLLVQKNVSCVDADDRFIGIKVRATERDRYATWNPLTDDGEALRLATKLCLWEPIRMAHRLLGSPACPDMYASVRRSIVVAAAEIGRLTY